MPKIPTYVYIVSDQQCQISFQMNYITCYYFSTPLNVTWTNTSLHDTACTHCYASCVIASLKWHKLHLLIVVSAFVFIQLMTIT